MAGFCRAMRVELNVETGDVTLDNVKNLLDDDTDFSWAAAKVIHAVLLCGMEQG